MIESIKTKNLSRTLFMCGLLLLSICVFHFHAFFPIDFDDCFQSHFAVFQHSLDIALFQNIGDNIAHAFHFTEQFLDFAENWNITYTDTAKERVW